ncbi:MAG: 5'/3'-nucleotidase SurE [Chloroflexales bacterium]|nr:5'/3'-nucleotidase SurE [Chloroflexales bacterium]
MLILITNDDGFQSGGLLALRQALAQVSETVVVAPDRNWSAAGRYRKLFDPLRVWETQLADGSAARTCDGTPADCVALAMMGLLDPRPDIVVSGINHGANLGDDLLYSGTVAAAMEGVMYGVPGIAVSLFGQGEQGWDFRAAGEAIATLIQKLQNHSLPEGMLLNVNVPTGPPEAIAGLRITRLGRRIYHDELLVRHDPRGRPYYWIAGPEPEADLEEGTDVAAIAAGYVSITPIHLDLTSHSWMNTLRGWGLED